MNNPLEKYIEKTIKIFASKLGYISYKFTSPSNRSVPDRVFMKKIKPCITCGNESELFFIEFKRKGKKATAAQHDCHLELIEHGCKVFIIDDVDEGKKLLEKFRFGTT